MIINRDMKSFMQVYKESQSQPEIPARIKNGGSSNYNANYEANWGPRSHKLSINATNINKYLDSNPNPIDWKKIGQWYSGVQAMLDTWTKKLESLSRTNPDMANQDGAQNWFNGDETFEMSIVYKLLNRLQSISHSSNPKAWKVITDEVNELYELISKVHKWNDQANPKYRGDSQGNISGNRDTRGTVRLPAPKQLGEP